MQANVTSCVLRLHISACIPMHLVGEIHFADRDVVDRETERYARARVCVCLATHICGQSQRCRWHTEIARARAGTLGARACN